MPCFVTYGQYPYVDTRDSSFGMADLTSFRRRLVRNTIAMENVAMLRTREVKPHHIHLVSALTIDMLNMPCKRVINQIG
jgi:hypothetical protein